MHRRRVNKSYILLPSLLLIIVAITIWLVKYFGSGNDSLEVVVSIVAIVSGASGIFLGIASLKSAQLENIREYFATGDSPELNEARKTIYQYEKYLEETGIHLYDDDFNMQDKGYDREKIEKAVSYVSNFFHLWGLLAKKNFLPLWTFEGASGVAIYRLYVASIDVIEKNRKYFNPFYAENFEWLYNAIKKKYKKDINKYFEIKSRK